MEVNIIVDSVGQHKSAGYSVDIEEVVAIRHHNEGGGPLGGEGVPVFSGVNRSMGAALIPQWRLTC